MSQKDNPLELAVAAKMRDLDPKARPTRGSGAGTELGDVLNKYFYVECKMRSTKNCTIDRRVMVKLLGQAAKAGKLHLYCLQNATGDQYVVMDLHEFFILAARAFKEE